METQFAGQYEVWISQQEIRHHNYQKPAGLRNPQAFFQDLLGIRHMFQDIQQGDDRKTIRREPGLGQALTLHVHLQHFSGVTARLRGDVDPVA